MKIDTYTKLLHCALSLFVLTAAVHGSEETKGEDNQKIDLGQFRIGENQYRNLSENVRQTLNDMSFNLKNLKRVNFVIEMLENNQGYLEPVSFTQTFNRLSGILNETKIEEIIQKLLYVRTENLTDAFFEAVKVLTNDTQVDSKFLVSALIQIDAKILTDKFIETLNSLSQGQNLFYKSRIISALGKVPAERLTNEFIAVVNRLSQGQAIDYKHKLIGTLAIAPANNLSDLANAFTNERLGQIRRFVPEYDALAMIGHLVEMEPNQWEGEITRVINQYRHDNTATTEPIDGLERSVRDLEIHHYSNTSIPTSSSSSALPMRLDAAVMQHMNNHLKAGDAMGYADAAALLNAWIEQKYSNSNVSTLTKAKNAAFHRLESDKDYEEAISTAVSFLEKFHPNKINLWLDGFLGESIDAYNRKKESCSKGIKERVATGMRTIDPELDKLFARAERPALTKIFIAGLNFSDTDRCKAITKELIKLGLNAGSTAEHAGELLEKHIRNWLAESGVSADKELEGDIETMKKLIAEDGVFEHYIQPILVKTA